MERQTDITDAWGEQTDPENERGETCGAIFEYDRHDDLSLARIEITDDNTTITRDRAWAAKVMGGEVIERIEASEVEAACFDFDDEYGQRMARKITAI